MKVFCSRASPLYFSLRRIERMVLEDHTFLPSGVGTPSAVRVLAMEMAELPAR